MTNIDPRYEVENDSIKAVLYAIGNTLKNLMPPGWGFALFIVETGDKGSTFYLSSLERETFLTSLEEFIKRERASHVNDNPAPTREATNLGDERRD